MKHTTKNWLNFGLLMILLLVAFAPSKALAQTPAKLDTTSAAKPGAVHPTTQSLHFQSGGHALNFDPRGVYVINGGNALRIEFVDAKVTSPVSQRSSGDEKTALLTDVRYSGLWRGIDLTYDAVSSGIMRSTYTVAPGADPSQIRLHYNNPLNLSQDRNLHIAFQGGEMVESAPVAWQEIDGKRTAVQIAFKLIDMQQVGFSVGNYNPSLPLFIDPTLTWNTFFGGPDFLNTSAMVVDSFGNVYVTGTSKSGNWETIAPPVHAHTSGQNTDVFVAKFTSTGTMVWYTFMGGNTDESAVDITLVSDGILVAGNTSSRWSPSGYTNYNMRRPFTPTDSSHVTYDGFVAKLNTIGDMGYVTFLGSHLDDGIQGLAIDGSGNIYVTGYSTVDGGETDIGEHPEDVNDWSGTALNLPDTNIATNLFMLTKLSPQGDLIWHTFYGGRLGVGKALVINNSEIFVIGNFDESNINVTNPWGVSPPVVSPTHTGLNNLVASFNVAGTVNWYTFLPESSPGIYNPRNFHAVKDIEIDLSGNLYVLDLAGGVVKLNANNGTFLQELIEPFLADPGTAQKIDLDTYGNIYMVGDSLSWGNSPVLAFHPGINNTYKDAFIAQFLPSGSLGWNAFLGSDANDTGTAFALKPSGDILISGTSEKSWGIGTTVFPHNGTGNSKRGFLASLVMQYKQPVIIVHGYQGLFFNPWSPNCEQKIGQFDGTKYDPASNTAAGASTLEDVPAWFQDAGYEVWIAHFTTSKSSTPHQEELVECLKKQFEIVGGNNPNPITVIAHSMGGVLSRRVIQANPKVISLYPYKLAPVKIEALYTMGSPHAGVSPLILRSSALPASCKNPETSVQRGFCELSESNMRDVINPNTHNKSGVKYTFIGGNPIKGPDGRKGDGAISSFSAVGWNPFGNFDPFDWTLSSPPLKQFWSHDAHGSQLGIDYLTNNNGQISRTVRCIMDLMNNQQPSSNDCFGVIRPAATATITPTQASTSTHVPTSTDVPGTPLPTSTDTFATPTPATPTPLPPTPTSFVEQDENVLEEIQLGEGNLAENTSVSIPVKVDGPGASIFTLSWDNDPAPTFTLTNPNSQVIDDAYAAAHPGEVTYNVQPGSIYTPPFATYSFPITQSGTWYLNITAAAAIHYVTSVQIDSSRTLAVETNAPTYHSGDTATITAHLTNNGSGVTGATVTADLGLPDGSNPTVVLTDQGGGTYAGSYTIPNLPGMVMFQVTAEGTAYTRQKSSSFWIASNDLQLTGNYDATAVDTDNDNLFDKLDFEVGVNLTTPATYVLEADLYSGNEFVAHSYSSLNLGSGEQNLTTPFSGEDIRQSGLDGPYTVTRVSLTPIEVGIASQKADDVFTTGPYLHTDFGTIYYTITGNTDLPDVVIHYTDELSRARTVTSDANGDYSFTVPYHWSGKVIPVKTGYQFEPESEDYTTLESDQNDQDYTPTAITYTISGNTSIGGVTLTYTPENGTPQTITSDAQGDYSLTGLPFGWSGTITPSLGNYIFRPANRTYSLFGNPTDQDYVTVHTISGMVVLGGVLLTYEDDGTRTVMSNPDGTYSLDVSDHWSGTVTPSVTGYVYTPKTYTDVTSDLSGEDYVPSDIPTITPTVTKTPTYTRTPTRTGTPTYTQTPTLTDVFTLPPTETDTPTSTETITPVPSFTDTPTQTLTPTLTLTLTPTLTPTPTLTLTSTLTPTLTLTLTPTLTATRTITPTPTSTPTVSPLIGDLALNKSATSSGSCEGGETADKAVNGAWANAMNDKWCDANSSTKWLQVDLGALYNVAKFMIYHAGKGGADPIYNTKDFNIQISVDGTNWSQRVTVTGNIADVTTHYISPTMARYIRLNIVTGAQNESTARIYELFVYGQPTSGIAAGSTHTCFINEIGGVMCWGAGIPSAPGTTPVISSSTDKVDLSGLSSGVSAMTMGNDFFCALTSTGGAKCLGYNFQGQLGDGNTNSGHNTAANVSGLSSGVSAITAAGGDTTAYACALVGASWGVKCWGAGYSSSPANVNSSLNNGVNAITAGDEHTCALLSGSVKCWGMNGNGQLGNGTTTNSGTTPVAVSGISTASAIAAGGTHTCALLTSGSVKCWGAGSYGQLGNGSTSSNTTPVDVSDLSNAIAIVTGKNHTCALLADGHVQCWGDNYYGQLGNGLASLGMRMTTPTDVDGLSNAIAIAAGDNHTCALLANGNVKCWGNNAYGQLGDGTTTNRTTPADVVWPAPTPTPTATVTKTVTPTPTLTKTPTLTPTKTATSTKTATPTITPVVVVFKSIGSEDGWVLETGTTNSSANVFIVGENATNHEYRSILSFDTSSLPANVTILSATLKIKHSSLEGNNPFELDGMRVDIRTGTFGTNALESTDFSSGSTYGQVAVFDGGHVNGWYSTLLNSNGINSIYRDGRTQFRLRFMTLSADTQDNYIRFISGSYADDQSLWPQLIVKYIP